MRKDLLASDIMQDLPYRLNPSDSLFKAGRMMKDHDFRHLPVVLGKKIAGMISITDYLHHKYKSGCDVEVEQVMSNPVFYLKDDASLDEVVKMFTDKKYHAVPVINAQEELVGIISTVDLITFLAAMNQV